MKTAALVANVGSAVAAARGRRPHLRVRGPIGVDVGARAIKAVQLGRDRFGDGAWRVVAVAEVPRAEAAAGAMPASAQVAGPEEVARLAGTLARQGFAGDEVVLAVPDARVLQNLLELPPRSSQAPLEQIARMEIARSQRCAPDSFEMGCWDLPAAARASRTTPVMTVACSHADAAAVIDPFEAAGLEVRALDVRAAALARACRPMVDASAGGIVAIVDLGWTAATLTVLHQGVVVYGRTLGDSGVCKLYQTLGNRLGLEADVIDYLLGESGLGASAGEAGDAAAGGAAPGKAASKAAADAAAMIAAHFEAAMGELRVSLTYTQHQYQETPVSQLLVVGGGANIKGVGDHVGNALGVRARAAAPADLARCAPHLAGACASASLTTALGLAAGEWG